MYTSAETVQPSRSRARRLDKCSYDRTQEGQQALGLQGTPKHMLNRMVHRGVLRRIALGVFGPEG